MNTTSPVFATMTALLRPLACSLLVASAAAGADPFPRLAPAGELLAAAAADAVVQRHVRDLGSPKFAAREAAAKALAADVDRALPALRTAYRDTNDLEISRRLEVLIRRVEADRLNTPRRVTLTAEKAGVRTVLDAVARQTGYRFTGALGKAEEVKMTVRWRDVTFWECVDEIAAATGLMADPDDNDPGAVALSDQDATNPYVCYSGPFRIVATNVSVNRSVQLSGIPRRGGASRQNEYLNLNLQVYAEPKAPIVCILTPDLSKATDDTGTSLLLPPDADGNRSYYYNPYFYKSHSQYVGLNLGRPGKAATAVAELKGTVLVRLLSGSRPEVVCDGILDAKKKKFVGRHTEIEVESSTHAATACTVVLTAKALNPDAADYSWANTIYQRLEVIDDNGVAWNPTSCNTLNQNVGSCNLNATFTPPAGAKAGGKPKTLHLVEWMTHPRTVAFHFKNIPLP